MPGAGRRTTIAWVERGEGDGRYALNCAPHDVAEFLRAHVVCAHAERRADQRHDFAAPNRGGDASSVCLSQTVARYRPCAGAGRAVAFRIRSPGAPVRRAGAPQSEVDRVRASAAPLVEECLDRTRGRAFVLFTSYARLREVYALLRERIAFPVRLQGELPRTQLLEWFRRTPNAVLFATGTFWEGIDVVGDALSCVIIDRLPFPTPERSARDGPHPRRSRRVGSAASSTT